MNHEDTITKDLRKRERGTWSIAERKEYYKELRWQRVFRLIERFGWMVLVIVATLLEIPMPWHSG